MLRTAAGRARRNPSGRQRGTIGEVGLLGFIGGTIFSAVLGLAERRRRFDQLSLPRFVAWGALGALVLGEMAAMAGILGAGASMLGPVMAGASALLGSVSAAGTLAIARSARGRGSLMEGDHDARAGLAGARSRGMLVSAE